MLASQKLEEILGQNITEANGSAIVEEVSKMPFVAVGFVPGEELSLILIIPPGLLSADVKTDRIIGRRNGTISVRRGNEEARPVQADYLRFDQLSPAVKVVLDALTELVTSPNPMGVGQRAADFIDLFKPASVLSDFELTGLFGELAVLSEFSKPDKAITCWHERLDSKYDFALEGFRLEVKTSLGSQRIHNFSSSQLPPNEAVEVTICSVLTEHVPDGKSVIDLWIELQENAENEISKGKLRDQVLSIIKKDLLKAESTTFDYELTKGSMQYFSALDIPTVQLQQGVLSASWEAHIEGIEPLTKSASSIWVELGMFHN